MIQILFAVGIALAVSIVLTPVLIRLFTRRGFGHEIREDGPASHQKKRGTPSMGGVAIVTGSDLAGMVARVAGAILPPEIRRFEAGERVQALAWLDGGDPVA